MDFVIHDGPVVGVPDLAGRRAQDHDNAQSLYGDSTVEAYPANSGDESTTTDGADTVSNGHPEVIKERYPSGEVKIEREVTQDAGGNYLNHGAWKMFDERGNLVAQGEYRLRQSHRHLDSLVSQRRAKPRC